MNFTPELILTIIIEICAGIAIVATVVANQKWMKESIDDLKHKQDKYNNVLERMIACEQSTKSAHHRLDDMERELHGGSKNV